MVCIQHGQTGNKLNNNGVFIMIEAIKITARLASLAILGVAATVMMAQIATMIGGGAEGVQKMLSMMTVVMTFLEHWLGEGANMLVGVAAGLFTLEMGILVYKGILVVQRVILKANEG